MDTIVYWIRKTGASCLFIGYFPYASGTIGSLAAIAALWFFKDDLAFITGPENAVNYWWAAITLTAISFFLCDKGKETFGSDDPKQTVFDEVVGQFITFFMIPVNWRTLLLGFVLFRFYDIVKPYPVYRLEEIEGGVGVTMDDVAAGILANVTLLASMWAYEWIMAYLVVSG
ncbi:MAG: phosphatidylglycerophosphatase A [Chitinispirillia bacterium]|nr:phosphatidylglycerophosphatase A [Chitinispirillia bacterium]MCL2241799.1 phosphatidylglycerophosphatase A [Chitinispirillia bacterium]